MPEARETVTVRDLKLGDVVRLFDGTFGDAVVKQITEDQVTFFRPYATTADFTYTGGVIPFIGIEDCTRRTDDTVIRMRKADPKR